MSLKFVIFLVLFTLALSSPQWTVQQAKDWVASVGWRVGCNFIPSTAENQLEMWQAATFDPKTIDLELSYAQQLNFNTLRVFLHYMAWGQDPQGFKNRMNTFLQIADSRGFKTMFVLFDDCWNLHAEIGPQPDPIPGVHNSRWLQSPGDNPEAPYGGWKAYTQDILTTFGQDPRVLMWDLHNEPGNGAGPFSEHHNATYPQLVAVYSWAREVNIIQPITSPIWSWDLWARDLNEFMKTQSDIITFHNYDPPLIFKLYFDGLLKEGRPIFCSEYMARQLDSRFTNIMPILKENNVGAINWGLVFGRTQTVFPWWSLKGSEVPKEWFHDIFWKNGTPWNLEEWYFIRNTTKSVANSNFREMELDTR